MHLVGYFRNYTRVSIVVVVVVVVVVVKIILIIVIMTVLQELQLSIWILASATRRDVSR